MTSILKKIRMYLPQIAFVCAVLWLFWEIYPIIFATHDDMRNYTLARRGMVFADALRSAKSGRISHLWNHHLLALPFRANKVWFYKLVQYASLLFDIFAGWKLLRAHADRRLADLAAVLFVSWASISAYHNLLISYALCHQIPIGFCFLSLYHFGNRLKEQSAKETFLSCFWLLLALMIYEAFSAMLLIYLLWALFVPARREVSFFAWLRRSAKRITPQLLTVAGYCMIYFAWQHFYPPAYDGIAMNLKEPFMSLVSVKTYALSFFPLWELLRLAKEHPITLPQFFGHLMHIAAWVSALLTAGTCYLLLPRIRLRAEKLRNLLLLSGLGIFLPCMLTAVSEKYMAWTRRGTDGYLPSFYSYFFVVVFLTAAAIRLYQSAPSVNRKKAARVILTGCVFCICLSASAVTSMWKPAFAQLSLRYRNFDYTVSKILPACDSGWQLCAPDNDGIHYARNYTEDFLKIYNPEQVDFIHDPAELDAAKKTLCMRMPENYAFAVTGEADSDLHAKTLTFRTLVPEGFNITLYDTEGQPFYYQDVHNGNQLNLPEGRLFDLSVRVENTPADAA